MAFTGSLMFRALTDAEEAQFRMFAQKNPPENLAKWALYHPICREEWIRQGIVPTDRPIYPDNETWVSTGVLP